MKVIAINSSRRKKNTYKVLSNVKEVLKEDGIECEIIHLFDYDIKPCIGCEKCILNGACVLKDDTELLMERLKESDGIILSSPVYMESISGLLKTFIDRTCVWFHRPELYGKPIFHVATTKGSGLKQTLKYLNRVSIQWGGYKTGNIGKSIRNIDEKVSANDCKYFIQHIKMDRSLYRPTLDSVINFNVQKALSKHLVALDEEYWEKHKWYQASYYYPCKMGFAKKMIGNTLFKILYKVMHKKKS